MKCQICKNDIKEWDQEGPKTHIIGTRTKDGHIHSHGDLEDKEHTPEIIEALAESTGYILNKEKAQLKKEYVFHNRQRIGDILMFTCAVRDFKRAYPDIRVNVVSTASHIWDHNPYIDRTLKKEDKDYNKIGPSKLTNSSNRIDWHFSNAYRVSIEDALGIHIPQGESYPDIYLTEEEYNAPRIDPEPYWLITLTGEKSWGCKMYPFDRWQAFVDQNHDIKFYQLGAMEDNPPRLQGKNVIDYVGKTQDKETGIRDLFKLFLNAEGSVGLVSFHMHLSAAFPGKPCIVVAGAREPVSFTQYAGHRYLATDGALPCGYPACWHCNISKCEDKVGEIPRCVDLIKPEDLTRALNMYYDGGRLKKGQVSEKPKFKNIVKLPPPVKVPVIKAEVPQGSTTCPQTGKYIKLVSTARGWGGCARSITTIMKFLVAQGHRVEFIPFRNRVGSNEFKEFLKGHPDITVTENYSTVTDPCDVLFMYADDYVWEFGTPEISGTFSSLKAAKKIMMLNYRRGGVGEIDWTKGWDKYMFLNSTQEKDLLKVLPGVKTKVLPPCTELEQFLNVKPEYNTGLRVMRHNSQGDTKFSKDFKTEVEAVLAARLDATLHMMPGPSFVEETDRFKKYHKNSPAIPEFLSLGNLFWYSLPDGYFDMGPRVILEAMAAGLPVIADNWGGAPDRVTPECGWICDTKQEQQTIMKHVSVADLKQKGEAAKQRAKDEFVPERWISEILY